MREGDMNIDRWEYAHKVCESDRCPVPSQQILPQIRKMRQVETKASFLVRLVTAPLLRSLRGHN